jgi:hypothetical protein
MPLTCELVDRKSQQKAPAEERALFEFSYATNLPYGSFVVVVVVCSFL